MPELPAPRPLATRRVTRQINVGGVLVGGDAPISVQSMTTTLTARRQRDPAADRRAHRRRLRDRAGRRAEPGRRGRAAEIAQQVPDPGDRRHPLPAQVRLRGDRRRLRGGAGQPGQHQDVRRQGRRDRAGGRGRTAPRSGSGSTPARWTRGCWPSTARPRPEALVESALWEARCSRSTTSATSRSRSSTTTRWSWSRPTGCSPSAATTRCTSV